MYVCIHLHRDLDNPLNQSHASGSIHDWPNFQPQVQETQYLDYASDGFVEDGDDDGADWFDMEGLGMIDDDLSGERFEFPVPTEPVSPVSHLRTATFSGQNFFINEEGFVQVYTHGECYVPFLEKPSIGVWFGPDHPS